MIKEIWHRYEDYRTCSFDADGDSMGGSRGHVRHREFEVVKHTPKGVQLTEYYGGDDCFSGYGQRFVLNESRKQYACPTIEKAKESFIARKNKQISIYQARINSAKEALDIINGEHWFTKVDGI